MLMFGKLILMVESFVRCVSDIPPEILSEGISGKRLVKLILELVVFCEFSSGRA